MQKEKKTKARNQKTQVVQKVTVCVGKQKHYDARTASNT